MTLISWIPAQQIAGMTAEIYSLVEDDSYLHIYVERLFRYKLMKKHISLNKTWYGLIMLVTLLPMIILIILIEHRAHSLLLNNAILTENQLNKGIVANINMETNRILTLMQNKSDPMAFTLTRTVNADMLKELLEVVLYREEAINSLSLISPENRVLISISRDGDTLNVNGAWINKGHLEDEDRHTDYEHLTHATPPQIVIPLHGRTYISSPVFNENSVDFYVSVPVGSLSSPVAVLTASVNTRKLWNRIEPLFERPDVSTYLVDSHGSLLLSHTSSAFQTGKLVTHMNIVRALIANEDWDSTKPYIGLKGESVFGIPSYINTLNWGVISEVPRKNITGPIYRVLLTVAIIIFLIALLSIGIGLVLVNRLLKPFLLLDKAFDRVTGGDYTTKLDGSPVTEVNNIVDRFNRMTLKINQMHTSSKTMMQHLQDSKRELEEREQRYRSLTYNIPGAVYRCANDHSWTMEFISDYIENISGYPCSDFVGNRVRSFASIIYDEDKQMIDEAVQEGLCRKTDFVIEYRIINSDSQFRWVYEKGQGIYDNKGELLHLSGVIFDVTRNKQAEGDIKKHIQTQNVLNNLLYTSLEEIPLLEQLENSLNLILSVPWMSTLTKSGIFLVEEEPDMLVLKVNRGLTAEILETCARVPFGRCICGRAALSGKVVHVDCVDKQHEIRYEGISPHGHYCVPIMDGVRVMGVLLLYLNKGHKRDDQEVLFLKSVTSALAGIIKRKHVENVLKESEEKYRTMFEASKLGMALCKTDGTLIECNQAYFKIIGYTKEEAMQLSYWDITPTTFKEDEDRQLRSLGETGQYGPYEKEYIRKDGIRIPVQVNGVLVKGADGNDYIWSIVQNITERKQVESEMAKITVELKERNEELERFHKITVGRELDMIRLKEEINTLLEKSGQPKKYEVPEE